MRARWIEIQRRMLERLDVGVEVLGDRADAAAKAPVAVLEVVRALLVAASDVGDVQQRAVVGLSHLAGVHDCAERLARVDRVCAARRGAVHGRGEYAYLRS
jgi:hypothetical protein